MTGTVTIPSKLAKRLDHVAATSGRRTKTIIHEALEMRPEYAEWLFKAVQSGFGSCFRSCLRKWPRISRPCSGRRDSAAYWTIWV
jgi:hypothetical protein